MRSKLAEITRDSPTAHAITSHALPPDASAQIAYPYHGRVSAAVTALGVRILRRSASSTCPSRWSA